MNMVWGGLPLPSAVDQILSELSAMTRLSWVAGPCNAWLIASLSCARPLCQERQ